MTQPDTDQQRENFTQVLPEPALRANRLHEMAVNLFSSSDSKGKEDALRAVNLLLESVALHATPQSLLNLAKLYMVANQPQSAIGWAEKCLLLCGQVTQSENARLLDEVDIAAHRLLGQAHAHLAQYEQALSHLTLHHKSLPADAANEFDLAYTLLALGQYEQGWGHYLVRYKPGFAVSGAKDLPKLPIPEWAGSAQSLQGKTILLVPEQGFGDEIHFARVSRNLKDMGARVWIMAKQPLQTLMRTLPWKERVVGSQWKDFKEVDLWTTSLKACALLRFNPFNEPPCCPYLMSEPSRAKELRLIIERLSSSRQIEVDKLNGAPLQVGINWRGNAQHFNDTARSMSLESLVEQVRGRLGDQINRANINQAQLISVQMGPTEHELKVMNQLGILNIAHHISNFSDLAAALTCFDHFFTVDSAPAHLAGALLVPTTLLVPPRIDWRWGIPESRPPWYSSLQVVLKDSSK